MGYYAIACHIGRIEYREAHAEVVCAVIMRPLGDAIGRIEWRYNASCMGKAETRIRESTKRELESGKASKTCHVGISDRPVIQRKHPCLLGHATNTYGYKS